MTLPTARPLGQGPGDRGDSRKNRATQEEQVKVRHVGSFAVVCAGLPRRADPADRYDAKPRTEGDEEEGDSPDRQPEGKRGQETRPHGYGMRLARNELSHDGRQASRDLRS